MQTLVFVLLFICYADAQTTPRVNANQTGLLFTSNATRNTISIANTTASSAGVWQPNTNLSSIFNGANGSAVIYNSESDTGIYIPGNASNLTWNNSVQQWPGYVQNLNLTHQFAWGQSNGTTFNKSNVPPEVINEVNNALSSWSPQYPFFQPDPFGVFANTSSSMLNLFNGPLNGLLTLIGDRAFLMAFDYFWMMEFLQGLRNFFNSINGGIPFLLNRRFFFNPYWAFNARNGIESFLSLLQAFQSPFNLPTLLNTNLNQPENFSRLLNQLGGNSCSRVNGRLRAAFERLTSRRRTCNPENTEDVQRELNESTRAFNSATSRFGPRFSGLRNFVRQLGRNEV